MISFGRIGDLELIRLLSWMFRVQEELFYLLFGMIRLTAVLESYTVLLRN